MARVLVVDDDPVIRSLLEVNLGLEGHEVVCAADGQEALDRVDELPPDLVLLDIGMPRVNGWQVAQQLKDDQATRHIPIVFLSARAMETDVRRGAQLGVNRYVTKPFDPIDLMDLVAHLLIAAPPRSPQ